jgi:hypothetical protein
MTGRLGFCIHARLEALVVGRVSRVGRMIRQHASMAGSVAAVYDLMDSAHRRGATTSLMGQAVSTGAG